MNLALITREDLEKAKKKPVEEKSLEKITEEIAETPSQKSERRVAAKNYKVVKILEEDISSTLGTEEEKIDN